MELSKYAPVVAPLCLQPSDFPLSPKRAVLESLVAREMIWFLKMAVDIVWAMCHDRHFYSADSALNVASFTNGINCASHEEATRLLCHPHFLHLVRPLRTVSSQRWPAFDSLSLMLLVCINRGPESNAPRLNWAIMSSTSAKVQKLQWKEERRKQVAHTETILTSQKWLKDLCPLLCTKRTSQCYQLLSSGIDWAMARSTQKRCKTKIIRIRSC